MAKEIGSMSKEKLMSDPAEQYWEIMRFVASVKKELTATTGPITSPEVFDVVADQIGKAGNGLNRDAILQGIRELGRHYVKIRKE